MLAISSKLTSLRVTPTLNRNGDVWWCNPTNYSLSALWMQVSLACKDACSLVESTCHLFPKNYQKIYPFPAEAYAECGQDEIREDRNTWRWWGRLMPWRTTRFHFWTNATGCSMQPRGYTSSNTFRYVNWLDDARCRCPLPSLSKHVMHVCAIWMKLILWPVE